MLIANGTVHDGRGSAFPASVRIEDGVITEVAQDLPAREGEEVFDAAGMEVMPGFIQAIGHWGVNGSMTEIRPSSQDNDELSDPITPELEAFYAFNGRAATTQQFGAWGLTAQGVAPTDNNLFGGTVSVVGLTGVNPYDLLIKRNVAMAASVMGSMRDAYGKRGAAPQTRMWIFTHFDEQLRLAEAYDPKPEEKPNDKLAALKPVVEGEMPLIVSCDSGVAIAHVRDILAKYPKVRFVVMNGSGLTGDEDWMVERGVSLIVRNPSSPLDEAGAPAPFSWKAVAKLMDKGVDVALAGEYSNTLGAREDLIWNAAELMKELHDEERVLTTITSAPAKILGVEDVIGAIAPGMRADVCVWSANPLKTYDAHAVRTFQAGEVVYAEGDEKTCM